MYTGWKKQKPFLLYLSLPTSCTVFLPSSLSFPFWNCRPFFIRSCPRAYKEVQGLPIRKEEREGERKRRKEGTNSSSCCSTSCPQPIVLMPPVSHLSLSMNTLQFAFCLHHFTKNAFAKFARDLPTAKSNGCFPFLIKLAHSLAENLKVIRQKLPQHPD